MRTKKEYIIMLICAVVFAITALCALFVPAVTSVDLRIIRFVQNFLSAIPSEIPATFTKLGSSGKLTIFVIVVGAILILFRKYQNAVIFLCGMPFVYAFYKFLKICFERPRPPVDMRLVEASNFSFPSGHSTMSMMFYGFLIYFAYKFIKNKILRNVIITFLCLTILSIGFTRIWLGVHYPSDILGGFSLGLFWLSLFVVLDKIDWKKAVKKNDG